MEENFDLEVKGPQDVLLDLPQERITGDILKGRGPRRGNLERLLRYWRPIMRKPGGFRRCRVILADHPELYPLNNICAWLHHETTGLWPNEGCHHPGMKNCRKKLKKITRGSIWSDADWNKRMARRFGKGKKTAFAPDLDDVFFSDDWYTKGLDVYDGEENNVVTLSDLQHAISVLADFMEMEKDFCGFLRDSNNWEIEGESDSGSLVKVLVPSDDEQDCGCE
jgi:hypothetical protein